MSDVPEGCASPSPGPIAQEETQATSTKEVTVKEVTMEKAQVGKPAPDFGLTAFVGEGFKNIKLSDYKGKWIVVCFYPGDFTFV